MKRKIIVIMAVIVIFLITLLLPCLLRYDFPIVFKEKNLELVYMNDPTHNTFNPLENVDFSSGHNVAYLLFERVDIKELPKKMSKSKLFKCSNNEILENLKRNFIFKKSGGDMATCESEILIYKENKLVLCSSFVLTDNVVGLQNSVVGWADALSQENLKKIFLKFKPTRKIFVKL